SVKPYDAHWLITSFCSPPPLNLLKAKSSIKSQKMHNSRQNFTKNRPFPLKNHDNHVIVCPLHEKNSYFIDPAPVKRHDANRRRSAEQLVAKSINCRMLTGENGCKRLVISGFSPNWLEKKLFTTWRRLCCSVKCSDGCEACRKDVSKNIL